MERERRREKAKKVSWFSIIPLKFKVSRLRISQFTSQILILSILTRSFGEGVVLGFLKVLSTFIVCMCWERDLPLLPGITQNTEDRDLKLRSSYTLMCYILIFCDLFHIQKYRMEREEWKLLEELRNISNRTNTKDNG